MMECFELGVPVWPVGQRGTWNQVVGFYVSFEIDDAEAAKNIILKVTAADCYRVWVNGVFFAYGPARTAHGYSRVDALPLVGVLVEGVNHLAIEVSSCGIDSYAYALHDPFLQAEILQCGQPLIATGGKGFGATL